MTAEALTDWLIQILPHEVGPFLQALVVHWDLARDGVVAACLGLLLVELIAVREVMP